MERSDQKVISQQMSRSLHGRQAVVVIPDPDSGNRDLWLVDLRAGGLTRLTSHPANDWQPAWEPHSAHIVFASDRSGTSGVYQKATNGAGEEEPIVQMARNTFPKDVSADGRFLLFTMDVPTGGTDIWAAPRVGAIHASAETPTHSTKDCGTTSRRAADPDAMWHGARRTVRDGNCWMGSAVGGQDELMDTGRRDAVERLHRARRRT